MARVLARLEVCLAANRTKLFHMGLTNVPARSTLSDALDLRDWRVYHALTMRLITHARSLYAKESLDIGIKRSLGTSENAVKT